MTNAGYTDDLVLLTNTSTQAESLLHSPEQVAGCIDLYVNAKKTKFICFKQKGAISTLSGQPLGLVGQFTYYLGKVMSTYA